MAKFLGVDSSIITFRVFTAGCGSVRKSGRQERDLQFVGPELEHIELGRIAEKLKSETLKH
jgi:hypothetical protein